MAGKNAIYELQTWYGDAKRIAVRGLTAGCSVKLRPLDTSDVRILSLSKPFNTSLHFDRPQIILRPSQPDLLLKRCAHVLDESAQFAAETLSSQFGGKAAKEADSKTYSPSMGSQTAARNRKCVM